MLALSTLCCIQLFQLMLFQVSGVGSFVVVVVVLEIVNLHMNCFNLCNIF